MAKNSNLQKAKIVKNDEFYTLLRDIEIELAHYKDFFKDKVVYLNCDDHETSNFWKYFEINFEFLGLKKLIATHYDPTQITYKIELENDINEDGKIDEKDIIKTPLSCNGDFRSPESIELLKEADVIVTNPPFSLCREYLAQLIGFKKYFLFIANSNAITCREIFPLIRGNKLWLGYSSPKIFRVPSITNKNCYEQNGEYFSKFGNICWFTNIPISKRNLPLILLPQQKTLMGYDNYCAVNCDKVVEIPSNEWVEVEIPDNRLQAWKDLYGEENIEIIKDED